MWVVNLERERDYVRNKKQDGILMKLSKVSLIGILCLISLSVIVPVSASTPLTIMAFNLYGLNGMPGFAYHDEGYLIGHISERILWPAIAEVAEEIRNLLTITGITGVSALAQ